MLWCYNFIIITSCQREVSKTKWNKTFINTKHSELRRYSFWIPQIDTIVSTIWKQVNVILIFNLERICGWGQFRSEKDSGFTLSEGHCPVTSVAFIFSILLLQVADMMQGCCVLWVNFASDYMQLNLATFVFCL